MSSNNSNDGPARELWPVFVIGAMVALAVIGQSLAWARWLFAAILVAAIVGFVWVRRDHPLRLLCWHVIPPAALGLGCALLEAPLKSPHLLTYPVTALSLWFFVLGMGTLFGLVGQPNRSEQWLRGAGLAATRAVVRLAKKEPHAACLGEVPIPVRIEPFHFLLTGATGSGKSLGFLQLLEAVRARGQRAIVVDAGGEFLRRLVRKGDVLLNPFDARSALWSPFAEIRSAWDCERLAKSLIPDTWGNDAEWNRYSQALVAAVLRRMWERGDGSNARLLEALTVTKAQTLGEMVAGLPAATLFDEGAAKMLASVRGIVGTYVAPLAWLDPAAGSKAFSVQQWVVQDQASWLFLTFRDDQLASLKPLIACWLDVAICAVLSLPPSDQRRVWFALDELATLGRVQSLTELLTKARKQGGCAVVGLQSVAQLRATYGRDGAQTLLSCLSTWLALRAPDPETAEYLSLTLGDEEIRRRNVSEIEHGQRSVSEQVTRSRIVLPGELQALPDRHGYLSLVGNYATCPVHIPLPINRPDVTRAFAERSAPMLPTSAVAKPVLKLHPPPDAGDRHAVDP